MPTLGAALDFAKLEGRNFRGHQLASAPSSPVTGQLYYNTGDNTLYWYNGSTWIAASAGAGGPPTGAAGGDLTGTYPNPTIAAGVVVDADVNASAAIAESKLNLATDAAVGTGSRRTLGSGAQQAMPGNRTLDAITAPAADLSLNAKKIIGLSDPTANNDAANKQYVDGLVSGLSVRNAVVVASTGNQATMSGIAQTIDGVALSGAGMRVLLKDQTTPSQNGIYTTAVGAWNRAPDMDAWTEVPGAFCFVERGTVNADTGWVCSADQGGTLNTTSITWVQFSAAGQVLGGAGLLKTGNTLDVGAGAGITVNADSVQVANNGITNAMIADGAIVLNTADVAGVLPIASGGTGTTSPATARAALVVPSLYTSATHSAGTTITITAATHGCGFLNARGLIVQCLVEATGVVVLPDVTIAANGDVTITFAVSQSANTIRTTITG